MSAQNILPLSAAVTQDQASPLASTQAPKYIVGIGASAGGLEALERLFEHMPPHTGMAFVVVQHLSPDFKSVMDELLARKTRIPIHRVEDSMEVHGDAIYLIPPKKDMIVANGRLLLTDKNPSQVVSLPIDHFFRSLAHEAVDRAIAIVLSGTGSDGSRGIREIHEAGGLVIVQSPETAKFDGMPNSATQTGTVDLVLAPEEIPAALLKYSKHPLWQERAHELQAERIPEASLDVIFRLLRDVYSIDFSHYKLTTVSRRIERRLLLNHAADLEDYVRRLQADSQELNALYRDLLIGVTRFFRDEDAFERLAREVLPALIGEVGRHEDLRVWVAGCATGEEAYTLAILIQECLESLRRPINVKIFASDVHRTSLDHASAGFYRDEQLAGVSSARLARRFVRKNEGYQVAHDLRQMVVFAPHNLLKDAPFTKLDLILCRNLLIYLQPHAQKKVLSLFHFALRTNGVLFLGPSESPGELNDEFALLDPHWKIYRKRRDIRLPTELRLPLVASGTALHPSALSSQPRPSWAAEQMFGTYDALLDEYMPPSLLVNEQHEVVQTFGDAGRYLQVRKGRVSTNVLDMVEPSLRIVLSGALARVSVENHAVTYKGLRVQLPDGERSVSLTVKPFPNKRTGSANILIVIEDQAAPLAGPATELDLGKESHERYTAMEAELRYTRENLQATIEEMETSNEELQATNEELVASNEELQSTNEELHSVNEELYTVNAEYQKKIAELTELTADMDNLLESTEVHTLFLDSKLCIRKFTPKIAETFNLLPHDIGRRIDNLTHNIDHPGLIEAILQVIEKDEWHERQVRDRRGRWYLLRILPYHTKQTIDGVVLTLIDMTSLKQAEADTFRIDRQLGSILQNSPHLVSIKDSAGRYLVTDETLVRMLGRDPIGRTARELFSPETAAILDEHDREVIANGATAEVEVSLPHVDGPHTYLAVKFPVRDQQGQVTGIGSIMTDVTRLKRAELQAREAVEQRDRFLAMLSHELRNPLGAIASAGNVLSHAQADDPKRALATEVVLRQAEQMRRLLDDLLDVSRITQNKLHLFKEAVVLEKIVDDALEVVQPALENSGLALEVHKDEGSFPLSGDATRLQQMLVNLLANAVKYTPAGGRVQLRLQRDGDQAVLQVRDTGVGIRLEIVDKVFDLFVQADNTLDRAGGGLGVGLTLVRGIVELHGGSVAAHSDGPGKGSTFTVRLPVQQESQAPPPVAPAAPLTGLEGTILIVEDNDDSRRMLATMLRLDNYRVATARDGQEGLQQFLAQKPVLAFVDVGLPGMSGYELARAARQQVSAEETYLVALTGYGRPEDTQAVLAAGFDEHLVKPLRRGDLQRVLERLRSRSKAPV